MVLVRDLIGAGRDFLLSPSEFRVKREGGGEPGEAIASRIAEEAKEGTERWEGKMTAAGESEGG